MPAVSKDAYLAIVLTGCTSILSATPVWATPPQLAPDANARFDDADAHGAGVAKTQLHIGRVSASQKSERLDKKPGLLKAQEPTAEMPPLAPNRASAGGFLPGSIAPPVVAASSRRSEKEIMLAGTRQFAQGSSVQAEGSFRKVLAQNPNNVDALFNLAALSERRGDQASALGFYRKALSLKPNDPELKQAVNSLETQLSASSTHNAPLRGSAVADNSEVDLMPPMAPQLAKVSRPPLIGTVMTNNIPAMQLYPQQARFAQQPQFAQGPFSVPVQTNPMQVPELSVHQPPVAQATVSQKWKTAIPMVHVGIGLVPGLGGLSCPVCRMLNSL